MQTAERTYLQSIDYDVLFECWAIANGLSLHAMAADSEWALTQVWREERVYARAALDLSKNALQRIARSLWIAQNGAEKLRALSSSYQVTTGSAITMMQWRMTMEQHAEAAE